MHDSLVRSVAEACLAEYAQVGLHPEGLGICLIEEGETSGFNAAKSFYPASVVKLFFLAYLAHRIEAGEICKTAEVDRAARAMIQVSSNEATSWIVDIVTSTSNGLELDDEELAVYEGNRQAVNRWLRSLGFTANVFQKTYDEGPYGREWQLYSAVSGNRNSVSPEEACRILRLISSGEVAPTQRDWMLDCLKRDARDSDYQSTRIGAALPAGASLWSKSGWMSTDRHDVARVIFPSDREIYLAIFTHGVSDHLEVVPWTAERLIEGLGA